MQALSTGDTVDGPFVGPGPFTEAHHELFHGREADVARLRSVLRTERIVVLHSPSGAGKTSLIQAGLIPRLRKEDDFRVFPIIRVGQELPSEHASRNANRFAYSAVHSLESGFADEGKDQSGVRADHELVGIRLSTYFAHRSAVQGTESRLLIFDQFEELFTRSPHDHRARIEFFTDLAKVLRDRSVWALFAMREEYVAALDRYKRLLPAQLAARFHLDLLTPAGARRAISRPAEKVGVEVAEEALELVVSDLARAASGSDRSTESAATDRLESDAAVIDPLHLQLLCVDVWEQLPEGTRRVDDKALQRLLRAKTRGAGDLSAVDWALLSYYDRTLQQACQRAVERSRREARAEVEPPARNSGSEPAAAQEIHGLERRVRYWIDDHLIESDRYRRQMTAEEEDLLLRETQEQLEDDHILRASVRIGTKWYEIAHDRMVAPVRRSNDQWYNLHHDRFQHAARRYHEEKYPQQFEYLSPRELEDEGYGKSLGEKGLEQLPEHERRYLKFCQQQTRRRRWRVAVAGLVALAVASGALITWPYFRGRLKKAYVATTALAGKLAEQQRQFEILQERQAILRRSGQVAGLYASAMTQRYRFENHDVALLLTKLAHDENRNLPSEARQPKLLLDSAFWAAIDAEPFSQTIPREILGGEATSLAAHGDDVYVTVARQAGDRRLTRIDTAAHRLELEKLCRPGVHAFAPDRRSAAVAGPGLEIFEVESGECRSLGEKAAVGSAVSPVAPVWSPDGQHVAAFLEDGGVAVYRAGGERPQPVAAFPRRTGAARTEGTRGSHKVTAVAFQDGIVAAGDAGGGVRFASLTEGSLAEARVPPRDFTAWEQYWPYSKEYGHPGSREEDAGIVAMSFLAFPGAAGDTSRDAAESEPADAWLGLAHRGSSRTKGGKVFVYRLADPAESYQLIADPESRIREDAFRQLGRAVERPGGEAIQSARFAIDGTWLVTAGGSGTVTRWSLAALGFSSRATLDELGHLELARGVDGAGAESPGGEIDYPVARGRRDVLRGARGGILDVAVTADGRHVAAIQARGARLWHLERLAVGHRTRKWVDVGFLYALAFDSRNRLITTDNRGRVQSWRAELTAAGTCGEGGAPEESPMQLCVEEDGYVAARLSASDGSRVGILSLDLADELLVLGTADRDPRLLDLAHPDAEPASKLLDRQSGVRHGDKISAVAVRPGNSELTAPYDVVTGDQRGTLIFWDVPRRESGPAAVESAFAVELASGPITGLAFHPEGRWLAAASFGGQLELFDMAGASCAAAEAPATDRRPCRAVSRTTPGEIRALAFSSAGNRLAVAGDTLSWWQLDADSEQPLPGDAQTVPGAVGPILAVAFIPGEGEILATTSGGSVQFWTLEESGWPIVLRGAGSELLSIAISPDGGLLAAGDGTGRFTVWDMDVSKYVCPLTMRDLTRTEWALNASRMEPRPICESPSSG